MYSKCVILIFVSGMSEKTPKQPSVSTWFLFVTPANVPVPTTTTTEPKHEGSFKLTALVLQASLLLTYLGSGEAAAVPNADWLVKKPRERNPLFMAFFKDPKKTLEKNEGILSTLKNIHIIHGTDWYIYLDELLIFMVNGVANIAVTLRIWHKNEAFTKKPVR